jgi:CheY-like chemotaxis protein/HPt (histidine-containing phosphotransfer) domain-containing protein
VPAWPIGRTVRVLLAEDNAMNQKVLVRTLARIGCRVDVAADGLEAVHAAARFRYDVILMDCQMPHMDGYAATTRLRAEMAGGPRVPIIALTANALAGDVERCLAAGMDDYLSKPVTLEQLRDALARHLVGPAHDAGGARGGRASRVAAPCSGEAGGEGAAVDRRGLMRLVEGEEDTRDSRAFVCELIEDFLSLAPGTCAQMADLVARGDARALGEVAHRFKSTSAAVGALALSALSQRLVEETRRGDAEAMRGNVARALAEWERVRRDLEVIRDELTAAPGVVAAPCAPVATA